MSELNYNHFLSILLFISVFAVLFAIQRKSKTTLPYHSKYILTNAEYKFYLALKSVMAERSYIICPKVGLIDLFEVNAKTKNREKYFWKICSKHIDFLICDCELRPLFAIELDDRSHNRAEVKKKDAFKDALFKSAGFPLYRIPTSSAYSKEYILSHLSFDNPNTIRR